ncbi:MAG: MGMT family protein [Gammaproteobacteria bacterium]|nr:MGMT family protein [Gammaproteobacteria bacterium]MDH5802146.1 MGMT family protein [Gammaproteobacteria bacterium]
MWRSVVRAMAKNPRLIEVPCHRVVLVAWVAMPWVRTKNTVIATRRGGDCQRESYGCGQVFVPLLTVNPHWPSG